MLRHLINCLRDFWLDLVLTWHAARADQLREDQEPYYRPIYRGLSFGPSRSELPVSVGARISAAAAHCINCGHRGSVLVPDGQEPAGLEGEILDMLECPECGLYTMCSD